MTINNHFKVSLIKSILRIIGFYFIKNKVGVFFLIFAEILGIYEEVVDDRE